MSAVILVSKDRLTSRGIIPSSQELFDLMHLTTCSQAMDMWRDSWMFCPVCLATQEADGMWEHKHPKELNQ